MAQGFFGKIASLLGFGGSDGSSASRTDTSFRESTNGAVDAATAQAGETAEAATVQAKKAAGTVRETALDATEATSDAASAAASKVATATASAKQMVSDATISATTAATSAADAATHAMQNNSDRKNGMTNVTMAVNGKDVSGEVEDRTLLVEFLRENLNLTGTHVGCDTSQCGACVVHIDGKAVKACTILAVQAEGSQVLTIEGLAGDGELHPMQSAFKENHGLQCGFCTPGMIMTAVDMVNRLGPGMDEKTIRHELEGNICRCTGYHNIVKSIAAGASAMGSSAKQAAE